MWDLWWTNVTGAGFLVALRIPLSILIPSVALHFLLIVSSMLYSLDIGSLKTSVPYSLILPFSSTQSDTLTAAVYKYIM
jgi:hypothetical protein